MKIFGCRVRALTVTLGLAASTVVALPFTAGAGQADTSPNVTQIDLVGPAGSGSFGEAVVVLTNGNYVVVDSNWDMGPTTGVGAVYLYDGLTNTVISTMTGTETNDRVGSGGVTALSNGNYVVNSKNLDHGGVANVGAVTWGDGTTGVSGPVDTTNSLLGATANDYVGNGGVTALTNGNYVVTSGSWDDGAVANVGAVTWGDGTTGISGPVTTTNSLHGTANNDDVGAGGVTALANGNYVAGSPFWNHGAVSNAGAATWGDGTTGISGPVTTTNSLHGTTTNDNVGSSGVTALTNGNYVARSSNWDNGAVADVGAVTWGDGTTGVSGPVTTTNSLHGTTNNDHVGSIGVAALTNGNYVVNSHNWNNGGVSNVGAATWGDGTTGISGPVTTTNSLHGSANNDNVGAGGVTALTNGNYVVGSHKWDHGAVSDAGAATWGDGTTGISGPVATTNSLHGSANNDNVGSIGVTALTNGNYVVRSDSWDDGAVSNAGAATWGNGTTGTSGPVTTANSLHGTANNDDVSSSGVTALTNGNYVVGSNNWNNGAFSYAGAVTWGDGTTGISGPVTTTNSLHGTTTEDYVGSDGVTALTNGNYVLGSYEWDNGAVVDAGAVTWGDGITGISGPVTTTNSLHGTTTEDYLGTGGVTPLPNGDFVATSNEWDDGGSVDAGSVTFGLGDVGVTGPVTSSNSVIGTPPGSVDSPSGLLTSDDALPVPTSQNRVLLMLLDRAPFFPSTPLDVSAATAAGDNSVAVTFGLPVAQDLRSTPTVSCVPGSGSMFAVGTTPVSCTATDSVGLTAVTGFDVIVTATAATPTTVTPTDFVAVPPARLLDTRPGTATIDGLFVGNGPQTAGSTLKLPVAGRGGVPANAGAVALNVTATNTTDNGFVTVYRCDMTLPTASNLNLNPGVNVPNSVITAIDANGEVCLFTSGMTGLIVDVGGYFPSTSTFTTINPARLIDTRPGTATIDGTSLGAGPTTAGQTTVIQVTGRAGVLAGATAAALNLTLTGTSASLFATIFPCDTTRPDASNINAAAGATIANSAISKLATDGSICVFTEQSTDLIVDVSGWFTNTSDYVAVTPARLLETRQGPTTIDGISQGAGLVAANSTTTLQVAGRGGAPANIATVVVNVTVTGTISPGFITVYPCDQPRPTASNLNYGTGTTVANNVIVKTSPTGTICFYNEAATHLITDINGYLPTQQ